MTFWDLIDKHFEQAVIGIATLAFFALCAYLAWLPLPSERSKRKGPQ